LKIILIARVRRVELKAYDISFEIIAACLSQNKLQELERFQSAITVNFNTLILN
jgi:hypothetical protein